MVQLTPLPSTYRVRAAQVSDRHAIRRLLKQFEAEIRSNGGLGPQQLIGWIGLGVLLLVALGLWWNPVSDWYLLRPHHLPQALNSALSYGVPLMTGLAIALMIITLILLAQEWQHYWVIEFQGQLVACAKLQRYLAYSVLFDLYVTSAHRHQGVGSALVHTLSHQAQKPLYLACVPARLPFYQRLGFAPISPKKLPTLLQYELGLATRPGIIPLVLQDVP
jgi:N-acetylglutamate synthase-like GNAT family acetyltransferase